MAGGTALAKAYNDALFGGLKAAGLQVIPVDTFHILQEIVASPSTYGFVNVTDKACLTATSLTCSPAAYATPDAYKTYVFADGVHPSSATHEMLGQYTLSILEAPRNQQILTHSAQTIGRSRADQVSWHLDGRPADGLSWWGNLRGDMQRYAHADLYDGMAPAGLFGVDWARDGMVVGGFAGYGRMDADFGNSKGDFTQSDTSLGLFAGWYGERVWVNGQVSYSWLDYDVTRKVQLGPATRIHEGSPEGSNLTAALNAGYEFGAEGGFRHGPVAAVIWQKVKLDGYTESNRAPPRWAMATRMSIPPSAASAGRPVSTAAASSRTCRSPTTTSSKTASRPARGCSRCRTWACTRCRAWSSTRTTPPLCWVRA